MLSYLREIVPYPSTLVGSSPLSPLAARAAPAVRAVTLLNGAAARAGVCLVEPWQDEVERTIGRCSQAVVYALWPSYFRGNMMTIDKKLQVEMY